MVNIMTGDWKIDASGMVKARESIKEEDKG